MKRIYVCVSNDVFGDNRVKKTCKSLKDYGLEVHIVCKRGKQNLQHKDTDFHFHPMRFLFKKNFLYYAELNIKILFMVLFKKIDILWANDLDTLFPMYIVSRLRRKSLIFDSHEMFTEIPELNDNPKVKKFWQFLEKSMVPNLKWIITVCNPIKDYFKEKYNANAIVVRNIPLYNENNQQRKLYPLKEKIIVWQGATNIDRSLEDLVLAMQNIDAKLYIIGRGDVFHTLEKEIEENNLSEKVFLLGRKSFSEMMSYTRRATIGLSIDRPTNGNYKISLPNKIFEYINAATPVLCTPLQEIKPIVKQYGTGDFIENPTKENLVDKINSMLNDNETLQRMSDNCLKAQKELSWQNEEKHIFSLLDKILK
ncbi:MAG: glycosyltransferase [Bacteroidales bacterium]|nr:glycosyltransferase [Bacteroidales bacterium]